EALVGAGFKSGQDFIWQYCISDGYTNHIVDFYFPRAKLIVEVKTKILASEPTSGLCTSPYDDVWRRRGYTVVRVLSTICETAPDRIVAEIRDRLERS